MLTHYVIVRRDLPIGVTFAQIAHAAGESFYKLCPGSSEKERPVFNREVAGSSPAWGSTTFDVSATIAVVLGARNEAKLQKLEATLIAAGVPHVAIREVDAPYTGSLMAIGLVPGSRDLYQYVREFHLYTEFTRM